MTWHSQAQNDPAQSTFTPLPLTHSPSYQTISGLPSHRFSHISPLSITISASNKAKAASDIGTRKKKKRDKSQSERSTWLQNHDRVHVAARPFVSLVSLCLVCLCPTELAPRPKLAREGAVNIAF